MDVQPIKVPQSLAYVLDTAGDKSNVDFDYLLKTAMRESSLNPAAKAPSSSAVGLFQFLDSTWLQVMKEEGPRLGYQKFADAITRDASGDYVVKDKKVRTEILKLREDPQVAADMAAAFTQANGQYLEAKFGRMPSPGELYIAHFLGPQGAEKLFNAGLKDPDQIAAKLFPSQAKANPQIFYDGSHARTIREVYKALVATHDSIEASPMPAPVPQPEPMFVAQQFASDSQSDASDPNAPAITPAAMSFSALYATSPDPYKPAPLIGAEAEAPLLSAAISRAAAPLVQAPASGDPLAAIDAAAGAPVGFTDAPPVPEVLQPVASGATPTPDNADAPLALLDPDPAQPAPATAPQVPQAPPAPQARIEMTPGVRPNSAFFTQLVWTGGQGP